MQLTATFLAILASQALSIHMWSHPDAEAECGALGVMEWDLDALQGDYDLPQLRKCREHPLSENIHSRDEDDGLNYLMKRKCVSNSTRGAACSDGWCWSTCRGATGSWCWLAKNNGTGAWQKCSSGCKARGLGCGKGNCKACGCGC